MDAFQNRSKNIPEYIRGKPETKWGSFLWWPSSWSGNLRLSVPLFKYSGPRQGFSQLLSVALNQFKHSKKKFPHKNTIRYTIFQSTIISLNIGGSPLRVLWDWGAVPNGAFSACFHIRHFWSLFFWLGWHIFKLDSHHHRWTGVINVVFVLSRTVTGRVCFKLKCSWFFTGRGSVKRNFWKKQLWWVSSCSEPFRLLGWQAENTASQQGSPSEQSPFGYRFSELLFLGVPGTATEQVQTCGLTRNSSRFDKTPKMRDSVRLNSLQIFLVTLPSFSSETWEMYFWTIPRSSVFCDWLFLVFSGVSLETATISLLILNVVMILREKLCQFWRLNWFFDL